MMLVSSCSYILLPRSHPLESVKAAVEIRHVSNIVIINISMVRLRGYRPTTVLFTFQPKG